MSDWTTVRISRASLARLKARAEADGLSATDCLHRLLEAPAAPAAGRAGRERVGPDPGVMTPGELARWQRKQGAA